MFEENERKSRLYVYLTEAAVAVLLISIMLSGLYWSYLWILGIVFSFFIGIIPVRHYVKRARMNLSDKKNNKYKSSFYHDAENEYLDHFDSILDWFKDKRNVTFNKEPGMIDLVFYVKNIKVHVEFHNESATTIISKNFDEKTIEYNYDDYYLFSDLLAKIRSDILFVIEESDNK